MDRNLFGTREGWGLLYNSLVGMYYSFLRQIGSFWKKPHVDWSSSFLK